MFCQLIQITRVVDPKCFELDPDPRIQNLKSKKVLRKSKSIPIKPVLRSRIRSRSRSDPHFFDPPEPDPEPHFEKKPDPDPHFEKRLEPEPHFGKWSEPEPDPQKNADPAPAPGHI